MESQRIGFYLQRIKFAVVVSGKIQNVDEYLVSSEVKYTKRRYCRQRMHGGLSFSGVCGASLYFQPKRLDDMNS